MKLRRVWRWLYAHSSHLAVFGVTLWGALFWFALRHEADVDLEWFVISTVFSLATCSLAIYRAERERQFERAASRRAAAVAEINRKVRFESDRRKAARLARIERAQRDFEERRRAQAEAPTERLPTWLRARPAVIRSLRNTAEDELRMQLRADLEARTGDVHAA